MTIVIDWLLAIAITIGVGVLAVREQAARERAEAWSQRRDRAAQLACEGHPFVWHSSQTMECYREVGP